MIARGRIAAQGTPTELLGDTPRTMVRPVQDGDAEAGLRHALRQASITFRDGTDGCLLTDADPADVGRAALRGGVALLELRSAHEDGGLERLFFQLTTDHQDGSVSTPELEEQFA